MLNGVRVDIRSFICFLVTAATVLAVPSLQAQSLDSKGKEFWVTFMSNGGNSPYPDLRIYLNCDRPTTASITYNMTGQSMQIEIPTANRPVEVNITMLFGDATDLGDVLAGKETSRKSFHIDADHDITLHGANLSARSADAYLGLPSEVLGRRYIVLSYPNGYSAMNGSTNGVYDMPSQFAVLCTEDSTDLLISPPPRVSINGRPDVAFAIRLGRGDVFLGQAELDGPQDVSGTEITSSRPVAVFSGNKRTSVPTRIGNFRNYLVEQLTPVELWGYETIVLPHFDIRPESLDTAIVRLVGSTNGTRLGITHPGGAADYLLNAGEVIEIPVRSEAMHITANAPFMAAAYEPSSPTESGGGNFPKGDPFMILLVPSAQFDTAYTFESIAYTEFTDHYINVAVRAGDTASLRLDDTVVKADFHPVIETDFYYAQIPVAAGPHHITAPSPFGLSVYGFGPATGYGYAGGMIFAGRSSAPVSPTISTDKSIQMVSPPQLLDRSRALFLVDLTLATCLDLKLVDLQGKVAVEPWKQLCLSAGNHSLMVNMHHLPAGIYLYQITTGRGEGLTGTIVVAR